MCVGLEFIGTSVGDPGIVARLNIHFSFPKGKRWRGKRRTTIQIPTRMCNSHQFLKNIIQVQRNNHRICVAGDTMSAFSSPLVAVARESLHHPC
jgi:hypothetical protein